MNRSISKKGQYFLIRVLIILFIIMVVQIDVYAATPDNFCGSEESDVTYTFDKKTGLLTISGTGETWNYWNTFVAAPNGTFNYANPFTDIKDDIKKVVINEGVTLVGDGLFEDCKNLTEIQLPASLEYISAKAFGNGKCPMLEKITVSSSSKYYCSDNGILYSKDKTKLICYPTNKSDDVFEAPAGVKEIGESAFYKNPFIEEVHIKPGCEVIRQNAFDECKELKKVEIGEGLREIEVSAFYYDKNLKELNLPGSLWNVGRYAFGYVSPDTVVFNGSKEKWDMIHFVSTGNETVSEWDVQFGNPSYEIDYSGVFGDGLRWSLVGDTLTISGVGNVPGPDDPSCVPWRGIVNKVKKIVVEEGITGIGWSVFSNMENVEEAILPEGLTYIAGHVFANCSSLKTVYLPSTLEEVYSCAFSNCTSLTDVYYNGTEAQWEKVSVDSPSDNIFLIEADIHCIDSVELPDVGTAVNGIKLDQKYVKLGYGQSVQLKATISPSTAENKNVIWSVDNQNWVTVDQSGVVSCNSVGFNRVLVTATTEDGGYTAQCTIETYYSGATETDYVPKEGVFPETSLEGSSVSVDLSGKTSKGNYSYSHPELQVDVSIYNHDTERWYDFDAHFNGEYVWENKPIRINVAAYMPQGDSYGSLWGSEGYDYEIEITGPNVSKKLIESAHSEKKDLRLSNYWRDDITRHTPYASYCTYMSTTALAQRLGKPKSGDINDLAIQIPFGITYKYTFDEIKTYSSAKEFVAKTGYMNSEKKYTRRIGTLQDMYLETHAQALEKVKDEMEQNQADGYFVEIIDGVPTYSIYYNFTEKQVIDAWVAEMETWNGHWELFRDGIRYGLDGTKTEGQPGYYVGNWGNTIVNLYKVGEYTYDIYDMYEYTIDGPGIYNITIKGVNGSTGQLSRTITIEDNHGWKKIGGLWRYYNASGEIEKGWFTDAGKWYYSDYAGNMQHGWLKYAGEWYYLGWPNDPDTGAMRTGWVYDGGKWYYMDSSGRMLTGWIRDGNTRYYLHSSGEMASNEYVGGYWINPNGSCTYPYKATWKQSGNRWWYGDESGWYAVNATYKIDGSKYHFDAKGYMGTGWQLIGNKWYLFADSGAMRTGWVQDGGTWYYLYPSGAMASNEYVGGYWLNPNGSWTYPHRASWHKSNGRWWYGDTSGWYAANATYKIDGVYYSFDSEGWMK